LTFATIASANAASTLRRRRSGADCRHQPTDHRKPCEVPDESIRDGVFASDGPRHAEYRVRHREHHHDGCRQSDCPPGQAALRMIGTHVDRSATCNVIDCHRTHLPREPSTGVDASAFSAPCRVPIRLLLVRSSPPPLGKQKGTTALIPPHEGPGLRQLTAASGASRPRTFGSCAAPSADVYGRWGEGFGT
jgi:hypothetical protein